MADPGGGRGQNGLGNALYGDSLGKVSVRVSVCALVFLRVPQPRSPAALGPSSRPPSAPHTHTPPPAPLRATRPSSKVSICWVRRTP